MTNATDTLLERARLRAGERLLLLAPPGEVEEIAGDALHRIQAGHAVAVVRGEPFLQGKLPAKLGIVDDNPACPQRLSGPFDAILSWGSVPFLASFESFLSPLPRLLRPGGRLVFELPCSGYSPVLQACDPEGGRWWLPSVNDWREALAEHGFREIEVARHVTRQHWLTVGELLDARVRPFPLDFENRAGVERQEQLRNALAEAFGGVDELELVLRYAVGYAMR